MSDGQSSWPIVEMTFAVVVIIVVLVGGIVCINGSLSFAQYGRTLAQLAVGVGLVTVGHGIRTRSK
jgi:hypothetical protein